MIKYNMHYKNTLNFCFKVNLLGLFQKGFIQDWAGRCDSCMANQTGHEFKHAVMTRPQCVAMRQPDAQT